ncbi:hypothetical protein HYC85_008170 [Camellia sinensis]|uniref:Uncharacterized protein n=1 Tax=Camellia sinensis TaxID=4442 RepID=A0A7J7HTD9_CAMSI|nr:hypothetical protein HYC85_008170 [Camellia sinensis]
MFDSLHPLLMIFFFSHWPVHMDLQNIEIVGGNGQLLLVSHYLLDINMQRQVFLLNS